MEITFTEIRFLYLLFGIPVILLLHFIFLKTGKKKALNFGNFETMARIKGIDIYSKNLTMLILFLVLYTLIVLSLAGSTLHRNAFTSETSYIIAIDSSRSMEAKDISPNRIDAAKETATDFVKKSLSGTNIGLISFSGNARTEQELTDNKALLIDSIKTIKLSQFGGTDLHDAIILSTNLLQGEQSKSIIIISDGQANIGDLDKAINYANKNDVIIHTIAIGSDDGGETSFGISKVDLESLTAISKNTGGIFSRAESKTEIADSFETLGNHGFRRVSTKLSTYFLLISIGIVLIIFSLSNGRFRVWP